MESTFLYPHQVERPFGRLLLLVVDWDGSRAILSLQRGWRGKEKQHPRPRAALDRYV